MILIRILKEKGEQFQLKRTKMKFVTALKLSFNNLRTKRSDLLNCLRFKYWDHQISGLCFHYPVDSKKQIDSTQAETMAKYPIRSQKQQQINRLIAIGHSVQKRPAGQIKTRKIVLWQSQ